MPSDPAQLYQPHGSPARPANTQSSTNTPSLPPSLPLNHVFSFPYPSSTVTTAAVAAPSSPTTPSQAPAHHQPSKRGRQSNSLSRPARAKQRKTDHSIIEKARRAKINQALAELKGLVPANWGREGSVGDAEDKGGDDNDTEGEDEGEDGLDDAEYDPRSTNLETRKRQSTGAQTAKARTSKGGGKEREFKLDILERTVGYIKEVIGRVTELEGEVEALRAGEKTAGAMTQDDRDECSRCSSQDIFERQREQEGKKRARDSFSEEEELERKERPSKRFQPIPPPALLPASTSSSNNVKSPAIPTQSRSRLPSISSWLPSALAARTSDSAQTSPPNHPILFNHLQSRSEPTSSQSPPYLLHPPSSVQFNPIHAHSSVALLPKLNSSGPNLIAPASSQRGSRDPGPVGTSSPSKGGPS